MVGMSHSHTTMSSKVIQKDFNNRFEIIKDQGHGPLKSSSTILKAKRDFLICKSSPRTNKCSFMLILGFDLNLIISRKTVHEAEYLASRTLIQNLIDKWCGKIILGQALFKSRKSVHIWIVPCFLSIGMGFETHSIKGTG